VQSKSFVSATVNRRSADEHMHSLPSTSSCYPLMVRQQSIRVQTCLS
jgi:hypothetical protein